MGSPVVHWELWSENPERLSEFYTDVFDWEITYVPEINYHMADPQGESGIGGGIMKPQQGPWPGNMALYIEVDDLDAYADRIQNAGGKIVVDKMEVASVGTLSLFEDPDGRVLGMWKREPQTA